MYITFEEYSDLYSDLTEKEFNLYAYDACYIADQRTFGVDGYLKLRYAMPTNERDLTAVKRCICGLTHEIACLEKAKSAGGFIERADGSIMGKTVNSVSSGSESVSYAVTSTIYELASSNIVLRNEYLNAYVDERLRGVLDKNGVNMLYMGVYPCTNEI